MNSIQSFWISVVPMRRVPSACGFRDTTRQLGIKPKRSEHYPGKAFDSLNHRPPF
jgi:hypothetical protein